MTNNFPCTHIRFLLHTYDPWSWGGFALATPVYPAKRQRHLRNRNTKTFLIIDIPNVSWQTSTNSWSTWSNKIVFDVAICNYRSNESQSKGTYCKRLRYLDRGRILPYAVKRGVQQPFTTALNFQIATNLISAGTKGRCTVLVETSFESITLQHKVKPLARKILADLH